MGNTVEVSWKGIKTISYNDDEYDVEFFAKGTHYHQSAVYYYKDGSGQPEEDEVDVTEIEYLSVTKNGESINVYDDNDLIARFDEEITDAIYDGLYEPIYADEIDYEKDYWNEEE